VKKIISTSLKASILVGHKHTLITKLKLSEIAKKRIKLHKLGIPLVIKDIISGDIKKYKSIREAAKNLNCSTSTLRVRILKEKEDLKNIRSLKV
jgi:hypothetical protein